MKGHGQARPSGFPLAGPARFVAASFLLIVLALILAPTAVAADQAVAPKADQPVPAIPAKKADPPILIGPSRVTLVGGKTLEAIAVFREPGRVRVVLEDDTEIDFDPVKVVSVVALADLPDEPPPVQAKPAPSKAGSKGAAAKAGATAPAPRKGDKNAAAPGAGGPTRVHAEPAGSGKSTSTAKGTSAAPPGSDAEGTAVDGEAEAGSGGSDARKEERDRDVEELAAMLQHAIANAALEGPGTGGSDDGSSSDAEDAEEAAAKSGKDATGASAAGAASAEGEAGDEKKVYKPRPEDFDATRPVNKAGFRFLGPKGKYPETPPQSEFPQPAEPATSLGFGSDTWRPTSGFSSTAKWATPMSPATSFSNRLSGLDAPITSFGPSWWAPTPTSWPGSVFPEAWRPKDGFAQSMEQKSPPPPPSGSSSSDSSK